MPGGLAALLDDVAAIAKLAAASIDDIGAAAAGPESRRPAWSWTMPRSPRAT
jgi:predicted DNA repair protein MutK